MDNRERGFIFSFLIFIFSLVILLSACSFGDDIEALRPSAPEKQDETAAPAAAVTVVAKTTPVQKAVVFVLTSSHTGVNTWRVYNAAAGGTPLATVNAAFAAPNLTLTAAGDDLAAGIYYVSVQQEGLAESSRLSLTVTVWDATAAPTAAVTEAAKTTSVQKAVVFALTSSHTGVNTWRVYNAAAGGTPLATVNAAFAAPNLTLTATGDDLATGLYYVSVQQEGFAESSRLALTVANAGIVIENTSVRLFLNNSADPLAEGGTTSIDAAETGTYTVNIAPGDYSEITWYLNGAALPQWSLSSSIVLSKRIPGIFLVSVETTAAGEKNTGSHFFAVE